MRLAVLVRVTGESLRGWELLDSLVDAVESQSRVVGASVAGGQNPTVYVTVEAATVGDAQEYAARAVQAALSDAGEADRQAVPGEAYDAAGRLRS